MDRVTGETIQKYRDWWANRNTSPVLIITAWDGSPGPAWPDSPRKYWLDFPSRLDRESYIIAHTRCYADAVPCLFSNFGPGVLGACMGGLYEYDWHTFWFREPVLHDLADIEKHRIQEDNFWWMKVIEYTDYALARSQGRFLVSVTDLGGGMDVLAGLRGTQQLLIDLIERPEEVKHALQVVYEEWMKMYDILSLRILKAQGAQIAWNGIYSEEPSYVLQNDFSCMISPEYFRQFDAPFLSDVCNRIPHAMYHLDGPGAVCHAEALIDIPNLRAIQWIPGSGAPGGDWPNHGGMNYWKDLLTRILNGGKSLEIYANPGEARHLINILPSKGLLMKLPCSSQRDAEGLAEALSAYSVMKDE